MKWATALGLLCLALPLYGQTAHREGQRPPSRESHLQTASWQRPSEEDREKARLRIGITKQQQDQIEQLYAETGKRMQASYAKLRDLYKQLETVYDQYDFDRQQAIRLRREISKARREIMENHAQNEEQLRRILNKDQFDRMRALLKEERDKRHPRRPGGPPPPGRMP